MTTLRFVFGDQLTRSLSALADLDPARDVVLMVEVAEECTHVRHHPKKIALFLSAMRHFAQSLGAEGIRVDYVRLDDPGNTGSFRGELIRAVKRCGARRVVVTEPGEWRVANDIEGWPAATGLPVEVRADTRFLCSRAEFADWAHDRRELRQEHFYRMMRRRHGVLMEGGAPVSGKWNFDADNRKRLPESVVIPSHPGIAPDSTTNAVLDLVRQRFTNHFGALDGFDYAVTATDAEAIFERFVAGELSHFGDFQDAMRMGSPTLFHSVVSPYLNIGLLDPRRLIERVERAYRDGEAPLNAAEGYIRQILGWREYVRGIYWLRMPDYARTNHLGADRPLPAFYWSSDTAMRCLAEVIGDTGRLAYAHHIQRLMVTGLFALLIGARPDIVNRWYLEVYADAVEWAQLPNTHGIALHADGGVVGSKPYAASGRYIDRMSDYCQHCAYQVGKTLGPRACPFNALYWDFLIRHEGRFRRNPRMTMMYRTLDRFTDEKRSEIRNQAAAFLATLD